MDDLLEASDAILIDGFRPTLVYTSDAILTQLLVGLLSLLPILSIFAVNAIYRLRNFSISSRCCVCAY